MRIEFDPTNPTEAAAVRAMLTALGPTEVHLTDVGETTRGLIANSAKVSQAVVDTLRVAPSTAETDPWHQGTTAPREQVVSDITQVPATDSNGEPHDPRIHSTPPKLNADGTWRAKRGVTAEQIAEVRAEREAAIIDGAGVDGHAPPPVGEIAAAFEEPVTAPLVEPVVSAPATPPAPPASGPLNTPTPAPTPPAPPADAGTKPTSEPAPVTTSPSFLDVMKAITAAQKDGKIDTAKVKELCAAVGAGESTMGLNGPDNGDKRVAFMALLKETINA